MDATSIIIKPIVSEKSYESIERGKYTFEVHPDAEKIQIKRAVEEMFKVSVVKVNTMSVKGKLKKQGRTMGRRKDTKKAIVTLKKGDKIEFFESK